MSRSIDPEKAKIGARIAQARSKLGLKQKDLAEKLGVTSGAVGQWERGWTMPDYTLWDRLAAVLQTNRDGLLTGRNQEDGDHARDFLERTMLRAMRDLPLEDRYNLVNDAEDLARSRSGSKANDKS